MKLIFSTFHQLQKVGNVPSNNRDCQVYKIHIQNSIVASWNSIEDNPKM